MWQLSRKNVSRKIEGRNFLSRNINRLEKNGPVQNRIQDLCRLRRIRYYQAKCAKNTTKFEFIMNQGTKVVDKVGYRKKSSTRLQYPCYREGKKHQLC